MHFELLLQYSPLRKLNTLITKKYILIFTRYNKKPISFYLFIVVLLFVEPPHSFINTFIFVKELALLFEVFSVGIIFQKMVKITKRRGIQRPENMVDYCVIYFI